MLATLAAFPQQLAAHFAAVPAGFERWKPASWEGIPSEHFSALEQLCHVRDIEIDGYQQRFRRTLDEDRPLLPSIDSEALSVERDYAGADAAAVLATIAAARARTLAMLAQLTPAQYARRAQFEGYGEVTLRSLMHYLCSHDQQHLAGLQWLLGQIEAIDRG
jgi:hypothetical protein